MGESADSVSGAELLPGVDPESWITEALNSRPPIPADRVDISELTTESGTTEATEPGWAWSRLPLWIATIQSTYEQIGDKPIMTLDLCSSVPVYAQRLRFLEFDRDGVRARGIIEELLSESVVVGLSQENAEFGLMARLLAGRQKTARRLLEAGIQESLYEITSNEAAGTSASNHLYRQRLREKLAAQRHGYTHNHETADRDSERGLRVESIDYEMSYLEYLAQMEIPDDSAEVREARQRLADGGSSEQDIEVAARKQAVGIERAEQFLDWQTGFVADRVVGNRRYRPARFFSMDSADPRSIATSAITNMPTSALSHDSFTHAVASLSEPLQHFKGNIFDPLPFPDNSLALITCFDAWPFHFQTDPELHTPDQDFGPITIEVLHNLYQKLAFGGKMVIFPWSMNGESYATSKGGSRALIDIAAAFGNSVDEQFDMKGIHRNTLLKYMSASDRETSVRMSPIFDSPNEHFIALVISKSNESSLRALRALNVGELAIKAEAQD